MNVNKAFSPLKILYEDEDIVSVEKPFGLLVIPDRYDPDKPNIKSILENIYGKILIVHRLDKGTSGVLLLAKTEHAHAKLNLLFEQRQVKKIYQAICRGNPHRSEGAIDAPIAESRRYPGRMELQERDGKKCLTKYAVIERFHGWSFIQAEPESGRMHQIRIHLCSLGVPILCDPLYGSEQPLLLSMLKRDFKAKKGVAEPSLIDRLALHARQLSFTHPLRNENLLVESPLPLDMQLALKMLRKYASVSV